MNEELRAEIYKEIIEFRDNTWNEAKKLPSFMLYKEHNLLAWVAISNAAYIAGGKKAEHKIKGLPS